MAASKEGGPAFCGSLTGWRCVGPIIAFGISSHATKQALAPAQVAVENAGASPVLYALLAASPLLGSILLPTLWGIAYERHEARVLVAVPLGELAGQLVLASGLLLFVWASAGGHAASAAAGVGKAAMALGLVAFSGFHGGVAVAQHTALARLLPRGLTSGFVAIVACTHITSALCNSLVPRVLHVGGLPALQLALLAPSLLLSVPAGCLLAWYSSHSSDGGSAPRAPVGRGASWFLQRDAGDSPCARLLDADGLLADPTAAPCACQREGNGALRSQHTVLLLGVWRALLLGLGHAFQSVLNGLVVSYGLSVEATGSLVGACQGAALLMLPLVGIAADVWGRRRLLVATSWMALGAAVALLAWGPTLSRPALGAVLLAWSLAQVVAPVLPLALVPANSPPRRHGGSPAAGGGGGSRALGHSFGLLETLASVAQVAFVLAIGVLREGTGAAHTARGFAPALWLLCAGMASAVGLSLFLATVLVDDADRACDDEAAA